MGKQSLFTLDLKEKRRLSAFRALLFFLLINYIELSLAYFGMFVIGLFGFSIGSLALFFVLWEFLFFIAHLDRSISSWLAGFAFFVLLLSFINAAFGFAFCLLFLIILFLETGKRSAYFKIFFALIFVSGLIWILIIPLIVFIFLPKRVLARFGFLDSLEIASL